MMPYTTTADLPESVQQALPLHAQSIYMEAFNQAWDDYKDPDKSRHSDDREEISHRNAWNSIKQEYEQVDNIWKRKFLIPFV